MKEKYHTPEIVCNLKNWDFKNYHPHSNTTLNNLKIMQMSTYNESKQVLNCLHDVYGISNAFLQKSVEDLLKNPNSVEIVYLGSVNGETVATVATVYFSVLVLLKYTSSQQLRIIESKG